MLIVDAHEDIAWNVLNFGRDYTRSVAQTRRLEAKTDIPEQGGVALLGWPEWTAGNIALIFATLFAVPATDKPQKWKSRTYRDPEEAHRLYQEQLSFYHRWVEQHPDKFYLITHRQDLETGLTAWHEGDHRIGLVLLMEGAEGIQHPRELSSWYKAGLRIIGPAWSATRYAGGTGQPGPFTPLGRILLEAMSEHNMILDISHLTDEGVVEALDYPGPIIASHSNARALHPSTLSPRHLTDDMVRRIAARQGVIGIVLLNIFLKDGLGWTDDRHLVTIDDIVIHIDHYCQLVGHARHIGIGSDFDGGFGLKHSPTGLDSIADLPRIGEALSQRGYSDEDIAKIFSENWLRILRQALP